MGEFFRMWSPTVVKHVVKGYFRGKKRCFQVLSFELFKDTKIEHSRENKRKQKKIGGFNKPPILV